MNRLPLPLLALTTLVALATQAHAGNNGYFVTYSSKIERGELELMLMTDVVQPSKFAREDGVGDTIAQMVELEYGITDKFATEFMVEWYFDLKTGDRQFTGFRWENRYRLFKRRVPLNPMLYIEYEDLDPKTRYKMEVSGWVRPPYTSTESEPDRERIIETRLVLSDDVGPVNISFNWINETDVTNGHTAFGYTLGAMWMIHAGSESGSAAVGERGYQCPMHASDNAGKPGKCGRCGMDRVPVSSTSTKSSACRCAKEMPGCSCNHCQGRGGACDCGHGRMVGLGLEFYGGLGDTESFGFDLSRQQHYFGPIFMYHMSARWMFHLQLAIGLSEASDDMVRLNFGYTF